MTDSTGVALDGLRERSRDEAPVEPFRRVVAVLIMVVTLLAALAAYEETRAANDEARAARDAQESTIESGTALVEGSAKRAQRGIAERLVDELDVRGTAFQSAAKSIGVTTGFSDALGGALAAAANRMRDLERTFFPSGPPGFDELQAKPALLHGEYEKAFAVERDGWSSIRGGLIAVITIFAVSLFLLGLTLTVPGGVRLAFLAFGCTAALAAVGWGASLVASTPRSPSKEAIDEYVAGTLVYRYREPSQGEDLREVYREAVAHFDRALLAKPDYAEAYQARGAALVAEDYVGRNPRGSKRGRADFERATELEPENHAAWGHLGNAQFWLGEYEGALQSVEHLLALRPKSPRGTLDRALYLAAAGRGGEVEGQVERARAILARLPEWQRTDVTGAFLEDLDTVAKSRPALRARADRLSDRVRKIAREIYASIRTFGPKHPSPMPVPGARVELSLSLSPERSVPGVPFPVVSLLVSMRYEGMSRTYRWLYDVTVNGRRLQVPISSSPGPWTLPVPSGEEPLDVPLPRLLESGDEFTVYVFVQGNELASATYVVR